MRGRNMLVRCLLGITPECIMRVDANTKNVLKIWPLTTIRWWAASPNSLTLVGGVGRYEHGCRNTSEKGIYSHSSPYTCLHLPLPGHSLPFLFFPFFSFLSLHFLVFLCFPSSFSPSVSQDFGDYSESFYSVQTTEGETISKLIANYIDILVQKKKPIYSEVEDNKDKPVMDFEVDPKK